MKYLIINGSPRKDNTWRLAMLAKDEIAAHEGAEFEEVHLIKENIPFCVSCLRCFFDGEEHCPHKAAQAIAQKIEEADALILTSPVYSLGETALVKNLIDHLSYKFHRPSCFTKHAFIISTTAGAGTGRVTKYLRDVLKHWGFNRVHKIGVNTREISGYQPTEKVERNVRRLAAKLAHDVERKKTYSPTIKRVMYYNVWRALATTSKDAERNADYRYWKSTKLIDTKYAPFIRVPLHRRLIGGMFFALFKRVF